MKRHLLPLLLFVGVAGLPVFRAQAQDKPVLNSAPAGPPPTPPRPVEPTPAPTQAPAPVVEPEPSPEPAAQPSPDRPSGLELPGAQARREAKEKESAQIANSKFFIYSGFSLGYNSYYAGTAQVSQFVIGASPALGYRITERLAAGPGITYSYSNYSVDNGRNKSGGSLRSNNIGIKAFAQFKVIDQFFIHGEYELTRARVLEYDTNNTPTGGKIDRVIESPLLGAGYRQQFSDRAAADIVLLYNLNDSFDSLYPNPVIRFNFLFNIGH